MSNLSQEQKTKVNNFLRSLNQRITNFIEEIVVESSGEAEIERGNGKGKSDWQQQGQDRRKTAQINELDQLLEDLQKPISEQDKVEEKKEQNNQSHIQSDHNSSMSSSRPTQNNKTQNHYRDQKNYNTSPSSGLPNHNINSQKTSTDLSSAISLLDRLKQR